MDRSKFGEDEGGCFCSQAQLSTGRILDSEPRSRCSSSRCFSARLADQGSLSLPSLEVNTTSAKEDQRTETDGCNLGNINVAQPILVPNDPKNETSKQSNNMASEQKMVLSRMEIIHKHRKKDGLDEQTILFLGKKTRDSTSRAYDRGWNKWVNWCQKHKRNPEEYNAVNVLNFLRSNIQYSNTHLNGLRSAIASVFAVIHDDKLPIADNTMIKDFFIAKKKSEVRIPAHLFRIGGF